MTDDGFFVDVNFLFKFRKPLWIPIPKFYICAMKWIAQLFLIVFVAFLATPTIVSLIEKSTDTSYFYNTAEEEQPHKEVKADLNYDFVYHFVVFSQSTSSLILSENLSKHDKIAASIFIPPPEQV